MNSLGQTTALIQVAPMLENLYAHTKNYYREAYAFHTWMNKKVLLLSSVLPKPAALVTYHLWKAVPYIAASVFLPTSLYIVGVIAVLAYKIITTPAKENPNLRSVQNGLGFSHIVSGSSSLIFGCFTHNSPAVISGLFWMLSGATLLCYSGLAEKVISSCNTQQNTGDAHVLPTS